MTDNLDQLRAARFAAEWINKHPGIKSGVYHLSSIEVLAQGGPFCACTITIRLDDERAKPNNLKVEQFETVGD